MVFLAIEEKRALKGRKANLENKVISSYFVIAIAKRTRDELVDIVMTCYIVIRNVW